MFTKFDQDCRNITEMTKYCHTFRLKDCDK